MNYMMDIMQNVHPQSRTPVLFYTMLALGLAGIAGLGFGAWIGKGDAMLFAMLQSGLSWCF
jgi:hypothetical protein